MHGTSLAAAGAPRSRAWIAFLAIAAAALGLRLVGIGFLTPHSPEPDNVFAIQPHLIRTQHPYETYSSYPLMVGYALLAWERADEPVAADAPIEEHLAASRRAPLRARWIVAFVSALVAPATWILARSFLGVGWASFAALLAATSLLHLNFSQQARPHAALTAALALALCAALRILRSGRWSDWLLASLAAAFALGFLHTGVFALLPLAAAHLLRREPRRAQDHVRLVAPLAAVAAAVLAFYPFALSNVVVRPERAAGGAWVFGQHVVDPSRFDGSGFARLGEGLVRNDPVLLGLAALGLAFGAAALARRRTAGRGRALLVVASFALPYALAFGSFARSVDRFALPLAPVLAVLAAYGLSRVAAALRVAATRVRWTRAIGPALGPILALAALGLPALAAVELVRLRARPDTLEIAAEWIDANLDPSRDRLWVQPGVELPLAYARDAVTRNATQPRMVTRFVWSRYQEAHEVRARRAWTVHELPESSDPFWGELAQRPDAALDGLGDSFVVCVRYSEDETMPRTRWLRAALLAYATRVLGCKSIYEPRHGVSSLLYDNLFFLDDLLGARCVGPSVEIFRLETAR